MRIEVHGDIDAFSAAAWPLLTSDEANHTVMLAALQGARQAHAAGAPDRGTTPWRSAAVVSGSTTVAAALRSRGNWLLGNGPDAACAALGAALSELAADTVPERGIVGPRAQVEAFASRCARRTRVELVMPLLKLMRAPDDGPAPAAGHLLPLDPATGELHWQRLIDWTMAFHAEARLTDPREQVEHNLRARLPRASLAFWIDAAGEPACLIGATLIAPSGARIGPVYTPPEHRGQGFARAAVVAGCRRLIEQGARAVFLFTDAANPISNSLYRRIGFAPIGEHLHLMFVADGAAATAELPPRA